MTTILPEPTGNPAIDTPAVLEQARSGLVQWQEGRYVLSAPPPYYPSSRWEGEACGATIIELAGDLWTSAAGAAPARFIAPYGGGDFSPGQEWSVDHLSIQGPGGYTLGKAPCKTTGVRLNSGARIGSSTYVTGFFAGVEMWGNHQKVSGKLADNGYGVEFPPGMPTVGNQALRDLDLTGATLAGIHIAGSGTLDSGVVGNVHCGFAPCGVLITDDPGGWDAAGNPVYNGAPSTRSGVTGTDATGISFECVGNGAIIDVSTGPSNVTLGSGDWSQTGHSWASQYRTALGPLASPALQAQWAVVARGISLPMTVRGGEGPMTPGSIGTWWAQEGGLTLVQDSLPVLGAGSLWSPLSQGTLRVQTSYGTVTALKMSAAVKAGDFVAGGQAMSACPAGGACLVRVPSWEP